MSMSEARKRANKKWNDENLNKLYDRINLVVKKGKKQIIKDFATSKGKSLNSFVNDAIDEKIQREQ